MMIRTKSRLRLCVTLLMVNLAFIWGNSLLPGELSGAFSDWVRDLIAPLFGSSPGESTGGGLLRKLAHFTEFLALGMCLRWLYGMLVQKQPWQMAFSAGSAIVTACIDETIQVFVPGRGPGLMDVGLDSLGAVLGITLLSVIHHYRKKHLEVTP